MKKRAVIIHWLIDYVSFTKGILLGYLYADAPHNYQPRTHTLKPPVILLAGLAERWGFLKTIGDFIAKNNYPVYIVPKLKSNFKTVSESAAIINEIIEKNNLKNVIILGHSKGGTIGKYMLLHHNQKERIIGVIAIATPFKGTLLCKIFPHKAYNEFIPQSQLIQNLQRNIKHNQKIISIAPQWDNHIWPQNGSYLEGAENIKLTINGHHRILFHKELQRIILYSLEKLTKKQV